MAAPHPEVITKAIKGQIPAIISTGEGDARHEMMVQFTTARFDPDDEGAPGFWTRLHEGDVGVIDRLIKSAEMVNFTYNTENARVNFQTSLLEKCRHHLIHRLLLLAWPKQINVVEQRQKPRVFVPSRFRLSCKIEVLAPDGSTAGTADARAWDISLEGASLVCPAHPFLADLQPDTTMRLTLRAPDAEEEHTYLGVHRYLNRLGDEKLRLGLQFCWSPDPTETAAQRSLKTLIEELDALWGRHSMMFALSPRRSRPGTVR